jgi:hypothetical protein
VDETIKVKFIGDTAELEKSSNRAAQSVNRVSQSIETLRAKMEARKQFLITETDISKIAVYNREIASLQGQISKIQNIGVGDSGLGQLGKGATTAFSSIRKLAYLLPGIGVAGLIGQFSELAIEMAKGGFTVDTIASKLGLLSKKAVDAKAVLNGFGDIFQEAAKKVADDSVKLEVFRQKLNDVNIPASERLKILKEYNAVADKTNQVDATQIGNLDLINQKIDAQNSLILKRALSVATMGKISEEANKLIENELKLQEDLSKRGFKSLDDYIQKQKEANKARADAFKINPQAFKDQQSADSLNAVRKGLDGVVNPALKAAGAFKDDESAFNSLVGSVQKGRGDLQKLIGSLSGLITVEGITTEKVQDKTTKENKTEFLFNFLPFDPSGKLKPEQRNTVLKAIDTFSKDFAGILKGIDFSRQAKTPDEKIQLALQFDAKLKAGKVELDTKAFADSIHKSLKPEDLLPPELFKNLDVAGQFIRGIQSESERIKNANVFNLPLNFNITTDLPSQIELFKTRLKQFGLEIPKTIQGVGLQGQPVELKLDDLIDTNKIANNDALEALKKAFALIKGQAISQVDQLNKALNDAVATISIEGLSSIGETIAAALTGGDIGDVFKQFEQTLGSAIEALGKQMITLFVTADLLKKAIKSIFTNPVIGIAAGVALVAVGATINGLPGSISLFLQAKDRFSF